MKVLITDASNPITWYWGMQGRVFPVSHIKDGHYFIPDEAAPNKGRFGPEGVHFPDGELLYTREEYDALKQEVLRLQTESDSLLAERDLLLRKLKRPAYKTVKLPPRVAEALEEFKKHSPDIDFLAWRLSQEPRQNDPNCLSILKERADDFSFIDLIDALRFGYTIEESPRDPSLGNQRDEAFKFEVILQIGQTLLSEPLDDLAEKIKEFAKKTYAAEA